MSTKLEYIPTPQQLKALACSSLSYTIVVSKSHSLYMLYANNEISKFELDVLGVVQLSADELASNVDQLITCLSAWDDNSKKEFELWRQQHNRQAVQQDFLYIPSQG